MNQREKAIQLKLDKAKALMKEVEYLLQNDFFTTAVSRLYYNCFHATKALLLTKDIAPKTHSGAAHLLHEHFVKQNLFDINHATFFSILMNKRIDSDYSDFMIANREEDFKLIEPAKQYLEYVIGLISTIQTDNTSL